MVNDGTFSDPTLKQAIASEAARIEVDPSLAASVEALFAQANAPAPLPLYRNRFLMLAAAVVVAGLSVAFFTLRPPAHEEEYTIAEARLWPAMASLYRADSFAATQPTAARVVEGPVLNDPRYQLIAVRSDTIETIPCTVADYRRADGTTLSVITTRASNLLREPEEENDERYDETSGSIRIVGQIKNDYWICVAAQSSAPAAMFEEALALTALASN